MATVLGIGFAVLFCLAFLAFFSFLPMGLAYLEGRGFFVWLDAKEKEMRVKGKAARERKLDNEG